MKMVSRKELLELVRLLEELQNEMKWAERTDKPLPPDLARGTEADWRARCARGKAEAPRLLASVAERIKRIDWSRME